MICSKPLPDLSQFPVHGFSNFIKSGVNICVISKKIKIRSLETFGRSLMYRRNNRGPSTDPCGTPHEIFK